MGTMTSVTIIGISVIIIALVVWLLGRKYNESKLKLEATGTRITNLESVVNTQGAAIAAASNKIDAVDHKQMIDQVKIGDLQASKLPLRLSGSSTGGQHLPTRQTDLNHQNDQAMTVMHTAVLLNNSHDSTPSYSSGSCGSSGSSDSGSTDSGSSCSSGGSDSY